MNNVFGRPLVAAFAAGPEADGDIGCIHREVQYTAGLPSAILIGGQCRAGLKTGIDSVAGEVVGKIVGDLVRLAVFKQGGVIYICIVYNPVQGSLIGIHPGIQRGSRQDLYSLVSSLHFAGIKGQAIANRPGGILPVLRPILVYGHGLDGRAADLVRTVAPSQFIIFIVAAGGFVRCSVFSIHNKQRAVHRLVACQGACGVTGAQGGAALHPVDLHLIGAGGIAESGGGIVAVRGIHPLLVDGDGLGGGRGPVRDGHLPHLMDEVGAPHRRTVHRAVIDRLGPIGAGPADGEAVVAVVCDRDLAVLFGVDRKARLLAVVGRAVRHQICPGVVGHPVHDLGRGGDGAPGADDRLGNRLPVVEGGGGILHHTPHKAGFGDRQPAGGGQQSRQGKAAGRAVTLGLGGLQLQRRHKRLDQNGLCCLIPRLVGGGDGGGAAGSGNAGDAQPAIGTGHPRVEVIATGGDGIGNDGLLEDLLPHPVVGGILRNRQRFAALDRGRDPVNVLDVHPQLQHFRLALPVQGILRPQLDDLDIFRHRTGEAVPLHRRRLPGEILDRKPLHLDPLGGDLGDGQFDLPGRFPGGGDRNLHRGNPLGGIVRVTVPVHLVLGQDLLCIRVFEHPDHPVQAGFQIPSGDGQLNGAGVASGGGAKGGGDGVSLLIQQGELGHILAFLTRFDLDAHRQADVQTPARRVLLLVDLPQFQ